MSLSTILPHLSILPQKQDTSGYSTNKSPPLEFVNQYSSSIATGLPGPGQEIELRKRSSKKSSTAYQEEEDVFHSRIPSLSSPRETPHHEHQRDSLPNQTTANNPDLGTQYQSQHLSPSTATTQLRFERDALFRFHPDITIFHATDLGATPRSHAGSKIAKYHAQISGLKRNVPDIVLRYADTPKLKVLSGDSYITASPAPPLGVAYFRWSRSVRMGFRNRDAHQGGLIWEEMRNTSSWCMHNKYEFSIELAPSALDIDHAALILPSSAEDYDTDTRVHFRWQRINSSADGLTSIWQRVLMMNYKLVQISPASSSALPDPPPTLATFLVDHRSVRNRGTLHLHAKVPRDLEVAIVLSCAAIHEKGYRRRCWAYRGISAGP